MMLEDDEVTVISDGSASRDEATIMAPADIVRQGLEADHSGGLSIGGKPMFPNAIVYVDKRDIEFWRSPAAEAANPSEKEAFRTSHQTVAPIVEAGRLRSFDGATDLFPGIKSMPAYGHTPVHVAYLIESKGEKLLLWGDVIHSSETQFANPSVSIQYDVDQNAAISTRKRLLEMAAHDGFLVGGAHISFPGLGHVKVEGQGYALVPVPYGAMQ